MSSSLVTYGIKKIIELKCFNEVKVTIPTPEEIATTLDLDKLDKLLYRELTKQAYRTPKSSRGFLATHCGGIPIFVDNTHNNAYILDKPSFLNNRHSIFKFLETRYKGDAVDLRVNYVDQEADCLTFTYWFK